MFIKDEAKIARSVGGAEWGVVYFGRLLTKSYEQDSVLEELRVFKDWQSSAVEHFEGL